MEPVRMASPVVLLRYDHGFDPLVAVGGDAASAEGAAAVDYGDFVSAAVAQNLDAVAGFVLVEAADSALYVTGVKKFHYDDVYGYKYTGNLLILHITLEKRSRVKPGMT